MRLDSLLVSKGLCRSRATASEAVKGACVTVDGKTVTKPSYEVKGDEIINITLTNEKYVSRGGYKLEKALTDFNIKVTDSACVDIGASTGGFTDCLLQNGAKSVLAIDSGSGQLDGKIASDSRVTSLENTNIRSFNPKTSGFADFICVDVSFISLKLVFPAVSMLLNREGRAICLIKPQFEAGRQDVGKKGIVKDPSVYRRVIRELVSSAEEQGLCVTGLVYSPITGGDGNIEFLCMLQKQGKAIDEQKINETVLQAVQQLRNKK